MKRFQLMQRVNVEGLYGAVQEALPHLKEEGASGTEGGRRRRIIVVCPPIYSRFFRGKTAYAVGKVGMSVLVKGLGMDFAREGVMEKGLAIGGLWPAVVSLFLFLFFFFTSLLCFFFNSFFHSVLVGCQGFGKTWYWAERKDRIGRANRRWDSRQERSMQWANKISSRQLSRPRQANLLAKTHPSPGTYGNQPFSQTLSSLC